VASVRAVKSVRQLTKYDSFLVATSAARLAIFSAFLFILFDSDTFRNPLLLRKALRGSRIGTRPEIG